MKSLFLTTFLIWAGLTYANTAEVAWKYEPPAGYVDASPGLGDLTGDGRQDIVIGTTAGMIVALTTEATEIWRQEMRGPISVSPSIGDLDGDGALEVVVMNRQGQLLCLQGATGTLLWETTLPGRLQWGETCLALADITGDSILEIVTGDRDGKVYAVSGRGEMLWSWQGDHGITQAPAIADLTSDSIPEILIGGDQVPLICLSAEGKELWRLPEGTGSNPMIYDLDGDGTPEILIGIDEKMSVLDNTGKIKWAYAMQRTIDGAMTVADADEDGQVEIYVVDLAGNLACLSREGQLRWSASVVERARRSPSVGNVDGDDALEILVANYSGGLHIFEPDGRLQERVPVSGGVNSTAVLVAMTDGAPGIIVPVSNEAMRLLLYPDAQPGAKLPWPEYQYDSRRSGFPQLAAVTAPVALELDYGNLHAGANVFKATVSNPEGRTIEVRLETSSGGGAPSVSVVQSADLSVESQLSYSVPMNQALNLEMSCVVSEGAAILARRSHTAHLIPFMKELGDAERLLSETETALPLLPDRTGLEERACFLRAQFALVQPRILTAAALSENERVDLRNTLSGLLPEIKALWNLVAAATRHTEKGATVFVCAANPWAPFGGMEELYEGRAGEPILQVEAFSGEKESAALNVFNFSGSPRTFRVEMDPLKNDGGAVAAHTAIALHNTVNVPTEMRDFSADALPVLNNGNLIHAPAWSACQLWLTLDAKVLTPGDWVGRIQLQSLDIEPVTAVAGLNVTIWEPRLPEHQPLSLCHWGYVHTSRLKDFPEEALADQVRNGTNVFVGTLYPKAKYDEQGNLVGEIDFADHDAYVKRHAPYGVILFCGYQGALKGPGGMESDMYAQAHVQWLRAWVEHLKGLGIGYEGWALYPVDEPGLSDGLVEHYLLMAKLAREADPNIRMYTDPVGRITEEELQRMLPYVDIWCPNRNGLILEKNNAAKLDIIRNSGKTVWMYECDANAKHQSPLGYYRAQAWLAWRLNMTGIGFWSYCTSQDDPWFRPGMRHDYLLVYQGNGVVTSKRWEAVRDGVEDYSLLAALRDIVNNPPADTAPEDLKAAQFLLAEGARDIALFCGLDDDDTVPGAEGLSGVRRLTDVRWEKLKTARRELAALLTRLGSQQ
jgi:outer membrane protein assembly factor BamB